ncbi:unnamed protein product [Polarella glacialis]|uniref:Uncharacterized protein n=1 Tax=Polarella glacialis TaxID=89957 RepID=A0A813H644_POLGL|nr:unnamed protein product [Polarella glacialis]
MQTSPSAVYVCACRHLTFCSQACLDKVNVDGHTTDYCGKGSSAGFAGTMQERVTTNKRDQKKQQKRIDEADSQASNNVRAYVEGRGRHDPSEGQYIVSPLRQRALDAADGDPTAIGTVALQLLRRTALQDKSGRVINGVDLNQSKYETDAKAVLYLYKAAAMRHRGTIVAYADKLYFGRGTDLRRREAQDVANMAHDLPREEQLYWKDEAKDMFESRGLLRRELEATVNSLVLFNHRIGQKLRRHCKADVGSARASVDQICAR